MKKLLLIFTLLLLLSSQGFSAPVAYSYQIAKSFSASGTQPGFIAGTGSAFHQLTWNVIGSLSGCSVRVDSSADGITYNVGDVIAAQPCTSNGQAISTSIIPNYVRINVVTLTGTGSLVTILDGYVNNPVTSTGTFPITKNAIASNWLNSYDSITGLFTATQPAESDITNLVADLALKAPLASSALTGVPTAPTAAVATNTTQIATTAFVIANATGSGANTALSNLASVAINLPLLAGADNTIALGDATHRWTNLFATALNCGIIGTTRCVITGNGGTSGSSTITFPLIAGTPTNGISLSNVLLVPDGASATAGYGFNSAINTGMFRSNASGNLFLEDAGTITFAVTTVGINIGSGMSIGFNTAATAGGTVNVRWTQGAGVPSGASCTTANGGSLYSRNDGTIVTSLYVCDNATGVWTAK